MVGVAAAAGGADRGQVHALVLELDGRSYHTTMAEIERDRRKDAWLQSHGQLILRVTDGRFRRDKPGVYRDLAAMLARRGAPAASARLAA